MDLKTFITETLCQIQEGVQDAIKRRVESGGGGAINPSYSSYGEDTRQIVEKVVFDVAVTASEGSETSGKGGLQVWGLNANAEAKGTRDQQVVSRIQFSVPIVAPTSVIEQDRTAAETAEKKRREDAQSEMIRRHNEENDRRRR